MSITQISKIQVKTGNIADLPQLDVGEFGWAVDDRKLYIGNDPSIIPAPPPPTPNNTEILTILSSLAGGSNTEVQYNKDGDLAGSEKFTFNDVTGNIDLQGNILPQTSNVYHLGVDDKRWKDIFLNDLITINAATIRGFANTWIEVPNINVVGNTHTSNIYVSGIADIPNLIVGNIVINGEVTINGDSIDTTANTFSLVNANATTIYFGGDATVLSMGASTGNTIINNNLVIGSDLNVSGGEITTVSAIASIFDTTATVINFGGDATVIDIGATTGQTTVNHDLNVLGNAVVHGNMSILGNLTYVNAESLSIEDPIITVGGGPNGAPLSSNDGKDRGLYMHYYTSEPVDAFMGWDNSNGEFALGSNVTFTTANSEIIFFNELGNLRLNSLFGESVVTTYGNITNVNASNIDGYQLNIAGNGNITYLTVNSLVANTISTLDISSSNLAIMNQLNWSNAFGNYAYISDIFNNNTYTGNTGVFFGDVTANNFNAYANVNVTVATITQALTVNSLSTTEYLDVYQTATANLVQSNNAVIANISASNIDGVTITSTSITSNTIISTSITSTSINSNTIAGNSITGTTITGNLIFEKISGVSYPIITLLDIGIAPGQVPLNSYLGDLAYQTSDFIKVGNLTIDNNIFLTNLSNLNTASTTVDIVNANATTVNFAGAATTLEIASTTGNTNINNNLIVDGNLSVIGSSLTATASTFNLVNTDATTVNFAGAATTLEIASASGNTNINNNLIVDLNTTILGNLILPKTITTTGVTGNVTINKQAGSVNFAASASNLWITNNLVDANSVILATVATDDATMKSVSAVASTGQFILYPNTTPTAETRVNWLIIN